METFGQKIKQLRQDNNMTQAELAKRLNTSNVLISMWEHNAWLPSVAYLQKICRVFGISLAYFDKAGEKVCKS